METPSRHQCLIYDGPPSRQLPALALMVQQKLNQGYRCLYLNSRPMVAGIRSCLAAMGVDVVEEVAKARLVLSAEPIAFSNGDFDVGMMLRTLTDAVDQALSDGHKGLWATGDMTWEFGPEKNFEKLMEYEWGLEGLFRKKPALSGICQYHHDTLPSEVARHGLLSHQTIFVNETLSLLNPHYISSGIANNQMASNPALDGMVAALCELRNMKS